MEAILIFAGFIVGVAVGTTAIGAGLLTVPLLILLGVRPMEAVGTALAVNFVTRLMAAWQHNRQKTVNYSWVLSLAVGSIPASIVTVALMRTAKAHLSVEALDIFALKFIGAMLILMAAIGIISDFIVHRKTFGEPSTLKLGVGKVGKVVAFFAGALTGASVTFTGIGAGGIIVAFLAVCTTLEPSTVVGTAIVHGIILTIVSLLGHAWVGEFNLTTAVLFSVGSIPGALIGSYASILVPKRALKLTLLTIVLLSGVRALM
ncbi:MAG: sulfite exporter TauE/SafE family protein [Armatimonadota bacterium]